MSNYGSDFGKVASTCVVCGEDFLHWPSARRVTCSMKCKFDLRRKPVRMNDIIEYRTWKAMRWRCSEGFSQRHDYFDRGIKVCERWDDFGNFFADMGHKPFPKATLDRIDNSLGYSPSNCRWATYTEQANNTRRTNFIVVQGKRLNLMDIQRKTGIHPETLRARIKKGWSLDKIMAVPIKAAERARDEHGLFV